MIKLRALLAELELPKNQFVSLDIAAEKENRTSTTVVGGPTNTDASTVHNTSVSYAEPAAKARKQRRALGLRAKPRLD